MHWLRSIGIIWGISLGLCLAVPNPACAQIRTLKAVSYAGKRYVALKDLAKMYGLSLKHQGKKSLLIRGQYTSLQFKTSGREATLNGCKIWLHAPVTKVRGKWSISDADAKYIVDPIVRPSAYLGARKTRTVVLDPGHGGKDPGTVVVQTYVPEHYVLKHAQKHDYNSFYKEEITHRKEHDLPPYVHLGKIIVRSKNEQMAEKVMLGLYDYIAEKIPKKDLLGPAPCAIARLRDYYRWNILVKDKSRSIMADKIREAIEGFKVPAICYLTVDIDTMGI